MNQSPSFVFLDSEIFFEGLKPSSCKGIVDHITNHQNFQIVTSITVLGETLFKIIEKKLDVSHTEKFVQLFIEWDTEIIFPDYSVSKICFHMGEDYIDSRMIGQPTDKVHLAYAISQSCQFFLTYDNGLIRYKIPTNLHKADFFKPITITPEQFKENYLKK